MHAFGRRAVSEPEKNLFCKKTISVKGSCYNLRNYRDKVILKLKNREDFIHILVCVSAVGCHYESQDSLVF